MNKYDTDQTHPLAGRSALIGPRKRGFDINDWRPVDCLHWRNPQLMPGDLQNRNPMKSHSVGTIGRPRRKHARQRRLKLPPWEYLNDVTSSTAKPGEDNQFVAGRHADKPLRYQSREVQPSFGSTFISLEGRALETGQFGAYDPTGFDPIAVCIHISPVKLPYVLLFMFILFFARG